MIAVDDHRSSDSGRLRTPGGRLCQTQAPWRTNLPTWLTRCAGPPPATRVRPR
jgi:hypothetical protein